MLHQTRARAALLFFALLIGSAVCAVADPTDELVGRWRWARSTDWLSGEVETPASTGEEREYVFRSSGEYTFFVNGASRESGNWSIELPPDNCGAWGIAIDFFVWCGGVTSDGSLLSLDGSYDVDGPTEEYDWLGPVPVGVRSWGDVKRSLAAEHAPR